MPTILLLLTALVPSTLSHPLSLLHKHRHHHHKHRHLNLHQLFSSLPSKAAPAVAQHPLQQPLTNPSPASTLDTANIYVNMTVTTAETAAPVSFLVPLLPEADIEKEDGGGGETTTPPPLHHARTARIAGVRYQDAGRGGFESPERIICYAHTFLSSRSTSEQNSNRSQHDSNGSRSRAFGQEDGEIDFAERGGRWFVPEGEVGGFSCRLHSLS
ncbi:MAG: hypothetical protein Q9202_000041 [Teloschistes flavicans]